jgi:hypothetical protein
MLTAGDSALQRCIRDDDAVDDGPKRWHAEGGVYVCLGTQRSGGVTRAIRPQLAGRCDAGHGGPRLTHATGPDARSRPRQAADRPAQHGLVLAACADCVAQTSTPVGPRTTSSSTSVARSGVHRRADDLHAGHKTITAEIASDEFGRVLDVCPR